MCVFHCWVWTKVPDWNFKLVNTVFRGSWPSLQTGTGEGGGSLSFPSCGTIGGVLSQATRSSGKRIKKKGRVQVRNVSSQTGNTNRKFHNSNSLGEGRGALKLKTFLWLRPAEPLFIVSWLSTWQVTYSIITDLFLPDWCPCLIDLTKSYSISANPGKYIISGAHYRAPDNFLVLERMDCIKSPLTSCFSWQAVLHYCITLGARGKTKTSGAQGSVFPLKRISPQDSRVTQQYVWQAVFSSNLMPPYCSGNCGRKRVRFSQRWLRML